MCASTLILICAFGAIKSPEPGAVGSRFGGKLLRFRKEDLTTIKTPLRTVVSAGSSPTRQLKSDCVGGSCSG